MGAFDTLLFLDEGEDTLSGGLSGGEVGAQGIQPVTPFGRRQCQLVARPVQLTGVCIELGAQVVAAPAARDRSRRATGELRRSLAAATLAKASGDGLQLLLSLRQEFGPALACRIALLGSDHVDHPQTQPILAAEGDLQRPLRSPKPWPSAQR